MGGSTICSSSDWLQYHATKSHLDVCLQVSFHFLQCIFQHVHLTRGQSQSGSMVRNVFFVCYSVIAGVCSNPLLAADGCDWSSALCKALTTGSVQPVLLPTAMETITSVEHGE